MVLITPLDVTTLTNLVGFISIYRVFSHRLYFLSFALLAATFASLLFHSTEAAEVPLWGGLFSFRHELFPKTAALGEGDGGVLCTYILPFLLSTPSSSHHAVVSFLAWGRSQSEVLLAIDELVALVFATFVTVWSCGGISALLSIIRSKTTLKYQLLVGIVALVVSDFLLKGWFHAVVHGLWHIIALNLPGELISVVVATTCSSSTKTKKRS